MPQAAAAASIGGVRVPPPFTPASARAQTRFLRLASPDLNSTVGITSARHVLWPLSPTSSMSRSAASPSPPPSASPASLVASPNDNVAPPDSAASRDSIELDDEAIDLLLPRSPRSQLPAARQLSSQPSAASAPGLVPAPPPPPLQQPPDDQLVARRLVFTPRRPATPAAPAPAAALSPDLALFLREAVGDSWRAAVSRATNLFSAYAATEGVSFETAPVEIVLSFLHDYFLRVRSSAAPLSMASALERARMERGLQPFSNHPLVLQWRQAVRRVRPAVPRALGATLFSPLQVVRRLPVDDSFASQRLRTLVLLRLVTLMRSSDVCAIKRSSIREMIDPIKRKILVFVFSSKSSSLARVAADTNYVEDFSRAVAQRLGALTAVHWSPALQLLAWLRVVEQLPAARLHDQLFTDGSGAALTSARLSSLVTHFLHSAGFDARFTSHSLRGVSNQMLQLLRVPEQDICLRAGWASRTANAVRIEHYARFRLVPDNFADLLFGLPGIDS